MAILLLAIFCASIFEVNGVCLRYIDATKESVSALETVHDRCEVFRNIAFSDLTNAGYVQNLLATAANGSDFCKIAASTTSATLSTTALPATSKTFDRFLGARCRDININLASRS